MPFLSSNVFLKASRTFPSLIYMLPDPKANVKSNQDKPFIKAGDSTYQIEDFEDVLTKIGNQSAINS